MIRIKLKALIDDKAFRERRRITLGDVADGTGISRATLNRMSNQPGYNATLEAINALCAYLDCSPCELLEYVPDDD